MTLENQIADLTTAATELTRQAVETKARADVAADAAKADADRALAERQQITTELQQAQTARNEAVAAAALAESTKVGGEDYVIPAVVQLLAGYTDVVDTAISDDVWAAHAYKWGGPRKVLAVAQANRVVLHDLTKPGVPEWMEFNGSWSFASGNMLVIAGTSQAPITSVEFAGDYLMVGSANGVDSGNACGLHVISFANDNCLVFASTSRRYKGSVESRNQQLGSVVDDSLPSLVQQDINSLAARVFCDNYVHPVSGLPLPTIAVATNGGVSVLVPDGAAGWGVQNLTNDRGSAVGSVGITEDGRIYFSTKTPTQGSRLYWAWLSDINGDKVFTDASAPFVRVTDSGIGFADQYISGFLEPSNSAVFATSHAKKDGIWLAHHNPSEHEATMVANVDEGYATPWMVGDVHCALLCDGEEGVKTGQNLIDNPVYTPVLGAEITQDGTKVTVVDGGSSPYQARAEIAFALQEGQAFWISGVASATGGKQCRVDLSKKFDNGAPIGFGLITSSTPEEFGFGAVVEQSGNYVLRLLPYAAHGDGDEAVFDNLAIDLCVADRSGRNNHAKIHGTLNRSKPTGSDIAVWSGFSNGANHLSHEMPDIGAGVFSVSGVVDVVTAGYRGVFDWTPDRENNLVCLRIQTSPTNLKFIAGDGLGTQVGSEYAMPDPTGCYAYTLCRDEGNNLIAYVNGREIGRDTGVTLNITHAVKTAIIGLYGQAGALVAAGDQKISQVTVTKTCPSPDQVRDMHRDMLAKLKKPSMLTAPVAAIAHDPVRDERCVIGSDRKLQRLTRRGTTIEQTIDVPADIGSVESLTVRNGEIVVGGSAGVWVSQPEQNLRAPRVIREPKTRTMQLGMGNATDTEYLLPYGWKPLEAFKSGTLLADGPAADGYPVQFQFNGYRWFLKFAQPPGEFRIAARAQEVKPC